jgi:peptidoglycan/xylan/chitin deacetylase (PgdA/CDA1 family)
VFAERLIPAGNAVAGRGRRLAATLAEAILPRSTAVWRGPPQPRRLALTFDDGPTDLTRDYLDVLESVGARATFFVLGDLCAKSPQLVDDVAKRGHELAGHGYTHRGFPSLSSLGLLVDELERTARLLPSSPGKRPIVRPPRGAVSLGSLVTCARAGFTTVLWSLDSGDWRTKSADDVVQAVVGREVEPGAIVLFHEGQTWTLEALRTIVVRLKDAGHELVTVGELLGS